MDELIKNIVGHAMCQNECLRRIKNSINNKDFDEALKLIDTMTAHNWRLIDGLS